LPGKHSRLPNNSLHPKATFGRVLINGLTVIPIFNPRNVTNIHNAQLNFYGKFGNKLSNIAADSICGRTSKPYYTNEKGTYPPKQVDDQKVMHEANRALDFFVMGAQKNAQAVAQRYYHTPQSSIDLLQKVGLVDMRTACNAWKCVFDRWSSMNPRGPDTAVNLGAVLHSIPEDVACLYVVMIACRGCFSGQRTWARMNKVLVQGGWPWLKRYTKAFAKSVFLAMVSLIAAVEVGILNVDVGDILMSLARTLVGRSGQMWRVRQNCRLKEKKIRIAAVHDDTKASVSPSLDAHP